MTPDMEKRRAELLLAELDLAYLIEPAEECVLVPAWTCDLRFSRMMDESLAFPEKLTSFLAEPDFIKYLNQIHYLRLPPKPSVQRLYEVQKLDSAAETSLEDAQIKQVCFSESMLKLKLENVCIFRESCRMEFWPAELNFYGVQLFNPERAAQVLRPGRLLAQVEFFQLEDCRSVFLETSDILYFLFQKAVLAFE